MDNTTNLFKVSIDSFKWRLPIEFVKIIDKNILARIIKQEVNIETGEIINEEEIQSNSLKVQFEYYHIHFAVTNTFNQTEVVVLINSKLLESKYLNGVTLGNIKEVYDKIISCNILDVTFEDFLGGNCTDIDFKKDIKVESTKEFDAFTLELERNTKPKKGIGFGCKRNSTLVNKGIQWNRRESATPANPFIKIYHKETEAIYNKNKDFFTHYVGLEHFKNIVRIEATIKNKNMAQKLGIKSLKLSDVLRLTNDETDKIIEYGIKQNLEQRIRNYKPKKLNQLSPQDKMNYAALTFIIDQGFTFETAIEHLLSSFTSEQNDRNQKTRNKKRLFKIYEEQIKGEIFEEKSNKTAKFFNEIGWF